MFKNYSYLIRQCAKKQQRKSLCPVSWGCRIHWLRLCRGVRLPQRVSCLNVKQFIWFIDRTLSVATTLDLSGPGSDGNEELLHIPQSSSIIGASLSDCLVLYPGHCLWRSCLFADMQSMYSTAPTKRPGWVWVNIRKKQFKGCIYLYINDMPMLNVLWGFFWLFLNHHQDNIKWCCPM